MQGKPRGTFERKAINAGGSEGKSRSTRSPGPGKNISKMQAEGPKQRMVRTSKTSPQRRGEGTVPPRKRTMAEQAMAARQGAEGPKRSVRRGKTTMLGAEAPKRNIRQRQNFGVKGGTLRRGAGGKTMRRYNASTGRWDVVGNVGKYK